MKEVSKENFLRMLTSLKWIHSRDNLHVPSVLRDQNANHVTFELAMTESFDVCIVVYERPSLK